MRVRPRASCPRAAPLAAALVLAAASAATALINPSYTPVHLVQQSDLVLRLEAGPLGEKGEVPVKIVRALKGTAPPALMLAADTDDATLLPELERALPAGRTMPALVFVGDFAAAGADAADASEKPVGALCVGLAWFGLYPKDGGAYRVGADPLKLKEVWAGGTEMLARSVEYITSDPRADVPPVVGVKWGGEMAVGRAPGAVAGLLAVDLPGSDRPHLLVLSDGGDRLLRPADDGRSMEDVTATVGLATRSRRAAWGDFTGDGRLDLASWDGRALVLHAMTEAGTLAPAGTPAALEAECLGLAALDAGTGPRAGLLASTPDAPVLLVADAKGTLGRRPLTADAALAQALGPAGPCVVADFDGDGVADVAQPRAKGLLLYRGVKPGEFAPAARACDARLPGGLTAAFAGDYDADGRLDVFLTGQDGCSLLANAGDGKFEETLEETGEIPYRSLPGILGGGPCDINGDGRLDALLVYRRTPPQVFFNRGFRCFGFAIDLDLAESDLAAAKATRQGQQGGAAADFTGDGADDVALAAPDGGVWILVRESPRGPAPSLSAALPAGGAGPLTVVAVDGKRPLGARVAAPGAPARFAKVEKGPLVLEWRMPDGRTHRRTVVVLGPTRVALEGK